MVSIALQCLARRGAWLAAFVMVVTAGPALADTNLPILPADDDRVMVATATATAEAATNLPALVQMAAADQQLADAEPAELDCLATAVWFESRGETLEGQLAVAQAVVNRARAGRWGNNICGVIKAPRQFSFNAAQVKRSTTTFTTAMAVARIAIAGLWHDMAEGAHSFHAGRMNPRWRLQRVAKIGNHIFYR